MRASLSWIRELLGGADAPLLSDPRAVAEALTMRGLEVAAIERPAAAVRELVVARVLEVERHPKADRLTVCRVDDGVSVRQVVCGAPNVTAGHTYPFVRPGASLPDGRVIGEAQLRGVRSEGMLLSARECGFGEDHAGIFEMPDGHAPGTPLAEALGLEDAIFELELTMNRPDCLGLVGLAREVAAAAGVAPPVAPAGRALPAGTPAWPVEIEDAADCPRYAAALVTGVSNAASPAWLARRLEAHGVRSLGLVVDITNYVLLEQGHPTHAFDAARLAGRRLGVRRARGGESIVTLDGAARTLSPEALVIVDGERPVALAGVMGGRDSEVSAETRDVVIESALFDPVVVRRSAKAQKLATEASRRFERGLDPDAPPRVLARVVEMLVDLAGGTPAGPPTDTAPHLAGARDLAVRPERIASLLGLDVSRERMRDALAPLGFAWRDGPDGRATVTVPGFRVDVSEEADIAEEVGRVIGYDALPVTNSNTSGVVARVTPLARAIARLREAFVGAGLVECVLPALVSPDDVARLAGRRALDTDRAAGPVLLANALGRESSSLRTSLWPGLLRAAERNRRLGSDDLRLFEIGKVFAADPSAPLGVRERYEASAVLGGRRAPRRPSEPGGVVELADIAGLCETVLLEAGVVDAPEVDCYDAPGLTPGHAARVRLQETTVGAFGPADPRTLQAIGCETPVYLLRLALDSLVAEAQRLRTYAEPPRFPAVKRDLSLVVPAGVTARAVAGVIRRAAGALLVRVELFDVFTGSALPPGTRSLAFALAFQSRETTLADQEVTGLVDRVVRSLEAELGVRVRET